jgi:DNA-binding transcriptional regulator LsrR (DeoR family)
MVKRAYLAQKSQKEIAEMLRVTPRTVQRDLAEIRGEMRKQIETHLPEIVYKLEDSYNMHMRLAIETFIILYSSPRKDKEGKWIDDRVLKLRAIEVARGLVADLDRLFGIRDVNQCRVTEEIEKRLKMLNKEKGIDSTENPDAPDNQSLPVDTGASEAK